MEGRRDLPTSQNKRTNGRRDAVLSSKTPEPIIVKWRRLFNFKISVHSQWLQWSHYQQELSEEETFPLRREPTRCQKYSSQAAVFKVAFLTSFQLSNTWGAKYLYLSSRADNWRTFWMNVFICEFKFSPWWRVMLNSKITVEITLSFQRPPPLTSETTLHKLLQ